MYFFLKKKYIITLIIQQIVALINYTNLISIKPPKLRISEYAQFARLLYYGTVDYKMTLTSILMLLKFAPIRYLLVGVFYSALRASYFLIKYICSNMDKLSNETEATVYKIKKL